MVQKIKEAMQDKTKRMVLLLSMLGVVIAVWAAIPAQQPCVHCGHDENASQNSGNALNSIDISAYIGDSKEIKKQVDAKPYVLFEFFALRCSHCIKSIDTLNKLDKNDKLSVIGYIAADPSKVRDFASLHGIEYAVSRIPEGYYDIFEPTAFPVSYLVDTKTMEIKARFVGEVSEDEVLSHL
ncbi:MAG: hypothetical protein JXQ77_06035 [Campylobacterales bacterium]|nr:hypothetical protein [Campylobacterales bacterium]